MSQNSRNAKHPRVVGIKAGRPRRNRAEMNVIRQAIVDIATGGDGVTVRHLFYCLVSAGIVEMTESEYEGTARLAMVQRRQGDLPFGSIIDGSRLYSAPPTYHGIKDAIRHTAWSYRRSYWRTADRQLEVWCEKDAIRALIEDTTSGLAVPNGHALVRLGNPVAGRGRGA
jgi:hypothetical protein